MYLHLLSLPKQKKMFYNPEAIEKLSKVARSYCLICQ